LKQVNPTIFSDRVIFHSKFLKITSKISSHVSEWNSLSRIVRGQSFQHNSNHIEEAMIIKIRSLTREFFIAKKTITKKI
jgi:hypothetical protein